jgi:hypothetical protein
MVCGEAVPECALPSSDSAVVVVDRAVLVDRIIFIRGRVGHHNADAGAVSRPATASHAWFLVNIGRGVDDDAGEVLSQSNLMEEVVNVATTVLIIA